jgi:2-oxoglutarate ferredoxin oxidoreductase subunit beta
VEALVVHDAHRADPTYAFALSRLTASGVLDQSPIGIFRDIAAPSYDDLSRAQLAEASARGSDDEALQALIAGGDTWNVR